MVNNFSKLIIDLEKVLHNYNYIKNIVGKKVSVAAVVKANSYGLGAGKVAPHLAHNGCTEFYVSHVAEGVALREILPTATIFVLHGAFESDAQLCHIHNLIPVVNNVTQFNDYMSYAKKLGKVLPCCIHVDTGMTRLGIDIEDVSLVLGKNEHLDIRYVLSHLACADEPGHPLNKKQLEAFQKIKLAYPNYKYSFANSAGVFLGAEYHFDQVRPGIAMYGGCPHMSDTNKMSPVVKLNSYIIDLHHIKAKSTIGYGASYDLMPGMVTATIPIGYADGYSRALSNRGYCCINGIMVQIIGRISMDLTTLDVSGIPEHLRQIGQEVEIVGDNISIEKIANMSTINYEVLTSLGSRYKREYI